MGTLVPSTSLNARFVICHPSLQLELDSMKLFGNKAWGLGDPYLGADHGSGNRVPGTSMAKGNSLVSFPW